MKVLKKSSVLILILTITILISFLDDAFAIPTFQTYIQGATAGTIGNDEDTWFNYYNPFNLYVVAAFGPNTINITDVTLLISVPQGQTGTILFTTSDGQPVLLSSSDTNPTANADRDVLIDITGDDAYATKNFFPNDLNFDNHYPVKDDVSDFIIYDLGGFGKEDKTLYEFDADAGNITFTTKDDPWGEQKEYLVYVTGFSRLHFDIYGLLEERQGSCGTRLAWKSNPKSHDSTAVVPEPTTLSLLGLGLLGLAGLKKKKV